MENQTNNTRKTQKNRTYMLTMRQTLSVKPQYSVFKGLVNMIYAIEGDITRHVFTIRKEGTEVMKLRKKFAKLLPEYTIEKDGQEIAHIKKRISLLTHDLCGTFGDKSLEIRPNWDAYIFDIMIDGKKPCHIEQKSTVINDSYEITMFDESMEELAVALAVICDHVSDKQEKSRYDE